MREAENIRKVEELNIQWMGFIFWSKSMRYVSERPVYLPTNCKRVGVFVNADIQEVKQKVEEYGIDIIQLHGHESPDYCTQLKNYTLIKAFNIATAIDLEATKPYEGIIDYFLFDTKAKMVGGNGTKFDWDILTTYHGDTPFLLSGGIGPDDTERIKGFHHPRCIGIDLNSRFEIEPGLKNINQLKTFIQKIRL